MSILYYICSDCFGILFNIYQDNMYHMELSKTAPPMRIHTIEPPPDTVP